MVEATEITALINTLSGDDRAAFDRACERLGKIGEPAVAPLLAALAQSKPVVQDFICRIFGRMGPQAEAAVPTSGAGGVKIVE